MEDPLVAISSRTTAEDEEQDREHQNDPTSLLRSSSSPFLPSGLLKNDAPQGPFALVYALDSFGHPERKSGGTGEVLKPVDVEGNEEEKEEEGGRAQAQESAERKLKKWRDEEEHLNWTNEDGTPHPLYSDGRGDLCYLDDATQRMRFIPDEVVFRSDPVLSKQEIAQLFMGFLEVAILSLLHHRRVYPPNFFEPAQKWGAPCWLSKTTALASFVADLVDSLAEEFAEGQTRRIAISLCNSANQALERFVLEFTDDSSCGPPSLREFESNLRACLFHLDATAAALPPLNFRGQGRFSVLDADRPADLTQELPSTDDSGKTSRSSGKSVELTRRTLIRRTSMLHRDMAIFLEQSA